MVGWHHGRRCLAVIPQTIQLALEVFCGRHDLKDHIFLLRGAAKVLKVVMRFKLQVLLLYFAGELAKISCKAWN